MDVAIAGLLLTAAALAAAIAVIRPAVITSNAAKVDRGIANFKARFDEVKKKQTALSLDVLKRTSQFQHYDLPMFTLEGWIFPIPIPVLKIEAELTNKTIEQTIDANALLKDLSLRGPITYSDAIVNVAKMTRFTNGQIYRPTSIDVADGSLAMGFHLAGYFDYLDTSEVLAYKELEERGQSRYRKELANPFDLTNRVASLGILTLTTVKHAQSPIFLMHRRSVDVVLASNLYHVVPAGEFTPSDISLTSVRNDFHLRKNIFREYAEEFLNHQDAQGDGSRTIDYNNSEPYRSLKEACESGNLSISAFGVGLDPLSLKPELLTIAVFEAETFDSIFPDIEENYEGKIIFEPFNAETVTAYIESPDVRSGAKACLSLSWQHRESLGLA
ncbi:hypothetical protein [Lentzea sp. NPDC092896]|uniref:hypothetical protein n=1 Tax=Lentzea sp. NPDC092896 TaxID=3364127 RepID=UPI00381004EB